MWHDTAKLEGLALTLPFNEHAVYVEHVEAQRDSPTDEHPK